MVGLPQPAVSCELEVGVGLGAGTFLFGRDREAYVGTTFTGWLSWAGVDTWAAAHMGLLGR